MTVARVENKLGIRASDTAAIVFDNCRVPADHLLGSAEVKRDDGGFKDVMATFDATRPIVAAMAIGVGRAALDFVRDFLKRAEGRDSLRHLAAPPDRGRARLHGDGSAAQGGAAADLARGLDARHGQAQQPRGLDGEGQGRPRGHADHAEGGRAAGTAGLLAQATWSRNGCATPRSTTSSRAPSRST